MEDQAMDVWHTSCDSTEKEQPNHPEGNVSGNVEKIVCRDNNDENRTGERARIHIACYGIRPEQTSVDEADRLIN
ncbi:hypothetical protein [uncultured Desulfobacter sp.]|uniref:hypothetical protein n=1 Tax=uncultured Desulfobacter sp. TaxID=240139 RepID=UPI0029C81394|nr:hypothetical protein [uncultured Desulfobacter sp.]